jgi:hypothetical protein
MKKSASLGLPEARRIVGGVEEKPAPCHLCRDNGWTEEATPAAESATVDRRKARDLLTLARAYQFGRSGLQVRRRFWFKRRGQCYDCGRIFVDKECLKNTVCFD